MTVKFPIIDIRKDITGTWNVLEITQTIVVPLTSPYIVRLWELPDNGTIESKPVISGMTLNDTTYTPGTGCFSVKYSTGDVIFNSGQAGNSYDITYYGKGSLIEADDINYLYDSTINLESDIISLSAAIDENSENPSIRIITTNDTLTETDFNLILDGSSNSVSGTLPTAIGIIGKIYNIKCINDTFSCTAETFDDQTIDGETNFELFENESITVQSDNVNWVII